jgi:hypothetical protein
MKTISWPRAIIAPIVSVAILAVILLRINGQDVWLYLTGCEMHWLLAALLVTLTLPLFSALRWRGIVSAMGYPIKLRSSLRVTMAVFPLNTFLPSKTGDLAKAAFLREQGGFVPLAGSVLFERMIDVTVLTMISAFGAIRMNRPVVLVLALGCAVVTSGVIVCLVFAHRLPLPRRLQQKAEDIGRAAHIVIRRGPALMLVILWSVLNWAGAMAEVYCLFRSIGITLPLITILAVFPLAIFAGLIPLTISGMGTRDGALVLLLSGVVTAEGALAVGLLYTTVSYWFLALLGLPFFLFSLQLFRNAKPLSSVE